MKLGVAELIAGTERPLGVGKTGAARCNLRVDGRPVAAIIKRGPVEQTYAEAFCALLLSAWGLPVPTPYVVMTGDQDGLAFASVDATYPNLMQHLGMDDLPEGSPERWAATRVAIHVAVHLANAPLAAAADEAIDNRDRNLGNILWDGQSDAWIDHAYSLGADTRHADANKLCQMALADGIAPTFQQSAMARGLAIDRTAPLAAAQACAVAFDAAGLAAFVAARMPGLAQRIVHRFPSPDDLLSSV